MADIKDTYHRIKNHMAVINSLIRLKASSAEDDSARTALEETGGLVTAVTLVYKLFYNGEREEGIPVSLYIRELLDSLRMSFKEDLSEPDISLPAEGYLIYPDKAVPLGIMLAELTGRSDRTSAVDLSAVIEGGWRLTISGNLFPDGSEPVLTDSLVSQLNGKEETSEDEDRSFLFPGDLLFLSD